MLFEKCYSLRNQAAFFDQPAVSYKSYWFLDKKPPKCKKTLKIFSLKNKFHNLQKVPKSTVPKTMICDKILLTKATSRILAI